MSLPEVLNLDYKTYAEFCQYIHILESRERMIQNDIAAYPHITDKKRKELHKDLYKTAFPDELNEVEVIKTDQLLIKLKR